VSDGNVRAALAACPLFEEIARDPAALDSLAAVCAVKRARAGDVVIAEASTGDELYVIREGRVRTEKRTPSRDPYTVRFQERGDVFGEMSLLDPDIRSATVIAETDCEFVVVDRARFLAFGDRHPAAGLLLTRRLAQGLAERLRRANEDVVTLFSALVQEIEQRL
jgi:CRP/FNR family transcriptional regulator, cyclic AMP receptor protein